MSRFSKIADMALIFGYGFMFAMFFIGFAFMRQPVIMHIIETQNAAIETRFIVNCSANRVGRVTCHKVDGGQNAN